MINKTKTFTTLGSVVVVISFPFAIVTLLC